MKNSRRNSKSANVSDKHQLSRLNKVVTITPLNESQAMALELLRKKQVVVLKGSSGSGKTFLATTHAANTYLKGHYKQIVLLRPYEQLSKSVGLLKGGVEEKVIPFMQSMLQDLAEVFGKAELDAKIAAGNVVLELLENVRGRSYADSIIVVDESQNIDERTMQCLMTRIEDSSQLILCGDSKQKDTKSSDGLKWLASTLSNIRANPPSYLKEEDIEVAHNNYGEVEFTNDDVVRGGWCALINRIVDHEPKRA